MHVALHIGLRIAFAVLALSPLILMQGRPDLAPAWLDDEAAGVPVVVWLAIFWFALFVVASWLPVHAGREPDGRPGDGPGDGNAR